MGVKISTVIIGSIDIDVDALKAIEGVTIFKVTDRKSCEEIVGKVSDNDVVFIIADGREVYYAEKFFSRIMPLKIFLVTEAQAADNKNLRDVLIQLPAQNFKQSAYNVASMVNDMVNVEGLVGLNFDDVKTLLKNSGQAIATIGEGKSGEEALNNALEGHDIESARAFLINFKTAKDEASTAEINAMTQKIKSKVNGDAKILWGVTVDESFGDTVKVAVIATKFI
ncbi:MAG: hypothetical protein IKZ58_07235 [Selenomonadaceae bacterium]|nr:hypothetical protein [Selenomonadaceae bacterium]